MLTSVVDAARSLWTEASGLLGLQGWAFSLAVLCGGAAYVVGWRALQQIRTQMADPRAGSGLLQLLRHGGARKDLVVRRTVSHVFDGDTIEVGGEHVVRLIGMDAPEKEKNQKCLRDAKRTGKSIGEIISQGESAARWLEKLLDGKTVELELDDQAGRTDPYGRTLAHVWTLDARGNREMLVAEKMVSIGQALPTTHDHKHEGRIAKSREEAKREGKGVDLGVPDPSDWGKAATSGQDKSATETDGGDPWHEEPNGLSISRPDSQKDTQTTSLLEWLTDRWSFGMKRLWASIFLVLMITGATGMPCAVAQETDPDSLRNRIKVLETRVDSLKEVIKHLRSGESEDSAQKDTEIIARFSGSGMKTTRPFSVSGPWEVRWDSSAEVFFLNGFEAGNPNSTYPSMIAGPNAPSRGSSYVDRGGRYYLKIQSSGSWRITVVPAD